ncbi:hypothetical protein [Rubrolithibacter danxiaensis]|uniref:hypothetical protein n=1 Tax=Rubrolithibacter danxiaensis TaxID=3390805 RepID=UPI003BF7B63A
MENKKKIAIVVSQVKMEEEDDLDLLFWLNKNASERLQEVYRLRKMYFTSHKCSFPAKIEKVANKRPL